MPIKKGEKLFVLRPSVDQIKSMQNNEPLKCKCPRCNGKTLRPEQREQLVSDPAYRFVQSNSEYMDVNFGVFKSLMDACLTVLQRYGQWNWCAEIQRVTAVFHNIQFYSMAQKPSGINHPFDLSLWMKHQKTITSNLNLMNCR